MFGQTEWSRMALDPLWYRAASKEKNEEKSPWTISSCEMDYVRVVHGVGFIRFSQEHGRVPDPGRTDPASSIVPSPT